MARAIQGVGGAIITPLSLTILSAAVSAGAARRRARRVGRRRRPGDRHRAARRWRHRRGSGLAVDLLGQRADRARRDPAGLRSASTRATDRRTASTSPASASSAAACSPSSGRSSTATSAAGPTRPSSARSSSGPSCCVALRRLGGPHRRADAAAPPLPLAGVQRREHRLAADDLRDVRLDLPARPVLPGRPGLQPAPGRPADPAVDDHADLRGADRRRPRRPHRRRAAVRGGMAIRRSGSPGFVDHRRRRSNTSRSSLRSSSPASGWACSSPRSPTSSCRPSGPRRRARPRARTTRSASSVACSGSRSSRRVHRQRSYATGQSFVDGLIPAMQIGAVVVGLGAVDGAVRSGHCLLASRGAGPAGGRRIAAGDLAAVGREDDPPGRLRHRHADQLGQGRWQNHQRPHGRSVRGSPRVA